MNRTDTIEDFIKNQCIRSCGVKVEANLLYVACREYFGLRENSFIGTRTFYEILRQSKYELRKSTGNKLFVFGIALKSGDFNASKTNL
ncbi:hypothetical protein PJ311_00235 [Bacillus sp. CLL-7-23]|uniref:Uncharacterized protein n=1 Tax=Bacillus changyiensis TaxID=3004103 RepID=A0ABT4WYC0_9BACI|nr:hypothetical protein [Bacillus changyiensis]MDA7025035.1 hypothetical protein [Bacillus changyiensis]